MMYYLGSHCWLWGGWGCEALQPSKALKISAAQQRPAAAQPLALLLHTHKLCVWTALLILLRDPTVLCLRLPDLGRAPRSFSLQRTRAHFLIVSPCSQTNAL